MNSTAETHAALEDLEYDGGILIWGGQKVTRIAEDLGRTPFYAYDSRRMTARVAKLRQLMPANLQLHYAMKANPMPDVVKHMVGLVDGLDVASAGELRVALGTGIDPRLVSFAGPGKRNEELNEAVKSGITINIESENEMRRIATIGADLGIQPSVAIRVNPDFELQNSGMNMGGRPSPFGVDAERVPVMLAELQDLALDFRGFHVYAGSQNLQAAAIDDSMQKTVELILRLASTTSLSVSTINLGGGLGIPYFPRDQQLDLERVAESATRATNRLRMELGNPEIIMELGRYLVGEAGIYVCQVLDIKESRGTCYAICDGGLHHHLAASGNFGQILRKNYPVVNVRRENEELNQITVVGPLCTPLDLLGENVSLGSTQEGSLIAILQSGAYGFTASPRDFLSHPACLEILL